MFKLKNENKNFCVQTHKLYTLQKRVIGVSFYAARNNS